jgi:hypothetical protein
VEIIYDGACWFTLKRNKMKEKTGEERNRNGRWGGKCGRALKANSDGEWSNDRGISPLHWYIKLPSATVLHQRGARRRYKK